MPRSITRRAESRARTTRRGSAALSGFRAGAMLFGGAKGMKWSIKVIGVKSLLNKYTKISKSVGFATLEAIQAALIEVKHETKRLILEGYYKPAYESGDLYNSIDGKITNLSLMLVQAEVGTKVYYSIYVHKGTKFMKGRKFLWDGLNNKKKKVTNMIKRGIKKDLKRTLL